jgi:hypothetical protein
MEYQYITGDEARDLLFFDDVYKLKYIKILDRYNLWYKNEFKILSIR